MFIVNNAEKKRNRISNIFKFLMFLANSRTVQLSLSNTPCRHVYALPPAEKAD